MKTKLKTRSQSRPAELIVYMEVYSSNRVVYRVTAGSIVRQGIRQPTYGIMLAANDLLSVCRRLLVIAAEDVGLAYPQAIVITKACVDSALQLGLPEARIPIAEAVVLLATSPKSNSAYEAINRAMADVEEYGAPDFPRHLQNKHFDGAEAAVRGQHYRYPHDYPNHYVRQQYLPDILKDKVYYQFGENRQEQAAAAYREKILREDQT